MDVEIKLHDSLKALPYAVTIAISLKPQIFPKVKKGPRLRSLDIQSSPFTNLSFYSTLCLLLLF